LSTLASTERFYVGSYLLAHCLSTRLCQRIRTAERQIVQILQRFAKTQSISAREIIEATTMLSPQYC
jgi:hypothetical protein